jgi:osmotically-inducible protein OsmY
MRELRKLAWAAVAALGLAAPAAAQQGTITSGGGRTTGNLSGTGGLTGGGSGTLGGSSLTSGGGIGSSGSSSGGLGSSSGGLSGGNSGSSLQGSALQSMQAAPKLSPPTGSASSSLDMTTNRFAGYYANPYYQGNTTQVNATPGGFGIAVVANSTSRGAITNARGGIGSTQSANQSGIMIPLPVQINYQARMMFPTPPVAAGRIQTDIRSVLDNTTIANRQGVQIITDANNNVTLRGTVKDDEEARLVEGLVRLTPGVGAIKNELTFPVVTPK